jgi:hypothetical protein
VAAAPSEVAPDSWENAADDAIEPDEMEDGLPDDMDLLDNEAEAALAAVALNPQVEIDEGGPSRVAPYLTGHVR